jgi:hypothetical protein
MVHDLRWLSHHRTRLAFESWYWHECNTISLFPCNSHNNTSKQAWPKSFWSQKKQVARDIHGILVIHEIGHTCKSGDCWKKWRCQLNLLNWCGYGLGMTTSQSYYLASFQGSMACSTWKLIWKTSTPPRVKFFHFLASLDCFWTADHLARRGMQHHSRFPLYDQELERMRHLISPRQV